MYHSASINHMAERDLKEFETDLKRYEAANRRSLAFGVLVLVVGLLSACLVCSAVVLLIR